MGNWCEIYETGSKPKGGYGIQLPGLDMPTKILTAVDTVRNITNGMKGIIQGRISEASPRVIRQFLPSEPGNDDYFKVLWNN